jgi:hypothetical protein
MFGRRSSSRTRAPRLLQLPDIAVAAKTLSGARHIAISIPIQYDHPENSSSAQHPKPLGSSPPSKFPPPVTVLKPVVEARESISSHRKTSLEGNRGSSQDTAPAAELLGPETAKTLKNYYTQLHRQHKLKAESISSLRTGESKSQRSSHTSTSTDNTRQDSQPSDPRHSGGTVYSAITISPQDYSGRLSNVSTSPSVLPTSPVTSDLPSRNSSVPKIPKPIQIELAQSYQAANFASQQDPPRSSVLWRHERTESLASETSNYSGHSALPDTPQGYVPPHIGQILKPTSPLPAPNRVLPDVPESPCIPDFLPSPSPPINRRKITIGLIDEVTGAHSGRARPGTGELITPTSQTRQERVRARKSRDMAALREKRGSRDTTSDAASTANASRASSPGSRPGSSPQHRTRRSMSRDKVRRNRSTITPIMLVADLAPQDGTGCLPDQPAKSSARKQVSNISLMARGTYTPPRSSTGSDSDTTAKMAEGNGFTADNSSKASAEQGLDGRRQERRVKRNTSLREKEMENRLRKIERDNAMLMNTLSGIAGSFGQLNSLLPRARPETRNVSLKEPIRRPQGVVEEIQKLEPVMRELQAGAGRVSMEAASRPRTVLRGEDEESSIS